MLRRKEANAAVHEPSSEALAGGRGVAFEIAGAAGGALGVVTDVELGRGASRAKRWDVFGQANMV